MATARFYRPLAFTGALAILVSGAATTTRAHGPSEVLQRAEMFDLATGDPVGGGAVLTRTTQAVRAQLFMSGLDGDAAYSVWWVIFNRPENCGESCDAADLGNAAVGGAVFNAGGFVTGADGTTNFTADLDAGRLPLGTDARPTPANQLFRGNGFRAEIHMVVRSHGPISPGSVTTQTTTFDPDCMICEDKIAAVFPPV